MLRLPFVAALCLLPAVVGAGPGGWQKLLTKDGVVVSTRHIPGQELPIFRGVGVIAADIYDLLAVIEDTDRHCEWRQRCHTSKILKRINEFDRIIYARIDMPWPVSDRDMVLKVKVTIDLASKTIGSRFRSTRGGPAPPAGVVRMARMNGMFRFRVLGPNRVHVVYQVDSDPGGWFPNWLVERTTRTLPVDTFAALRKRARKMRGKYTAFHKKYDPAHGGKVPARFRKAAVGAGAR